MHKTFKHLLLVLALAACLGLISALAGQIIVSAASQPKTLDRNLEPVVVTGSNVAALIDAPVGQLFVYTYTGASLGGQIPMQVDEVIAGGSYTAAEDGRLDSNDEIVFMAADLGARLPATVSLTTTLPISSTWYEIEVYDPTAPAKKGWAYLVRSASLGSTASGDYAGYNAPNRRITSGQYTAEFTTTHAGLENLRLNGTSTDILDRTKLRVVVNFFGTFTFTEDDLPPTNPNPLLIKDGPVRVVLQRDVQQSFLSGAVSANLSTTYFAYASLLQATARISLTTGGISVSSVRTSFDFDSDAAGATFFNANTPAGVTINGVPDTVAATPLSGWFQVSHPTGRLIQITNSAAAGGTRQNFYRDNSAPESPDTGQPGSFGESGIVYSGNFNSNFVLRSSIFFLPPAGGGSDNTGAVYEQFFDHPLATIAHLPPDFPRVYLPIITR